MCFRIGKCLVNSHSIFFSLLVDFSLLQAHDSAAVQQQAETWQEERAVSKYAEDLEQITSHRKVPMDPSQVR